MKSLANLAEAMKRTRKLCAVMIDSVGRELIINRPTTDEEDGWPTFEAGISVEANQKAWPQARASVMLLLRICAQHCACACTRAWTCRGQQTGMPLAACHVGLVICMPSMACSSHI